MPAETASPRWSTGAGSRSAPRSLCLGPFVPLIFMGEEWGATTPWPFFSSFSEPTLAAAVSEGRRAEFAQHGWAADSVPDPQDPATFVAAQLDWSEAQAEPGRGLLAWYRELLALRRRTPGLTAARPRSCDLTVDESCGTFVADLGAVLVAVNLGGVTRHLTLDVVEGRRASLCLQQRRPGGPRRVDPHPAAGLGRHPRARRADALTSGDGRCFSRGLVSSASHNTPGV